MALELAGSRVMAPYVGTTIFVWTSIIGVIMASLSIGYWLGGKIADQKKDEVTLGRIILAASFAIAILASVDNIILENIHTLSVEIESLMGSIILFAPASIFLGMVSPYAAKLRLDKKETAGRTVGNLYAISTAGSILGTFLAGFYLIAFLGNRQILVLLSLALFLLALSLRPFRQRPLITIICAAALCFLLLLSLGSKLSNTIKEIDTKYARYIIGETNEFSGEKRSVRVLATSYFEWQSVFYADNFEPVDNYTSYFRLADYFNSDVEKGLALGGGAFSYPRIYAKEHPKGTLDVIEIDPELVPIAEEYFHFQKPSNMNIYHKDARDYLNHNENIYDAIYVDVFNTFIPFHVTTREAVERIYQSLDDKGVVVVNIISSLEGDNSKFFKAEYATYKEYFPNLYVFAVTDNNDGQVIQNVMLVASKDNQRLGLDKDNPVYGKYFKNLWAKDITLDIPPLTDNFAPTDQYSRGTLY